MPAGPKAPWLLSVSRPSPRTVVSLTFPPALDSHHFVALSQLLQLLRLQRPLPILHHFVCRKPRHLTV